LKEIIMDVQCKVCVVRKVNELTVEQVTVKAPGPGEVMVKVIGCGMCLSDAHVINGHLPAQLPVVLGHEGAGVIAQVGAGVTDVNVGDSVVICVVAVCGRCDMCAGNHFALCRNGGLAARTKGPRILDKNNAPLNQMAGTACMGEYTTVHRMNVVPIDKSIPLNRACLVGCGVQTGTGAVFNRAKVTPGSTCCCIGTGGVGLNVIQACRISGAKTIIAVDLLDNKLEAAKKFGATHVINPTKDGDAVKAIKQIVKGGVDFGFEVIGTGPTYKQAYDAVARGGTAVMVGVPTADTKITMDAAPITFDEKWFTGSIMGSGNPSVDAPRLLDLYRKGDLLLDELVTQHYTIDEVHQSVEDINAGKNLRGVLIMADQSAKL